MAIFIPLVTKFDPKGLSMAQNALSKFGGFAAEVGKAAAAAIAAVGVASVREATQFESSFAKIQGLVGVTADEIGELEDAAKRLGPEFGKSATEAGDALFFITSAGLRGAEATEVLEASLKGAAIGLGETKTIADLATSAMNAFGAENLSGTKAVDVLAEAVRLGKAEPADFADALGMVLPIASEMGISFDQVAGSVAAMSKTGSDARIATTQLRQVMATILSPTAGANKALADMGLSAQGLRDQIKEEGLLATLQTLKDRFGDNEEAASMVFGNIRALMGVLDLMGKNAEDNARIMSLMADDVGILDEALAITGQTAEFKFNKAMAGARGILLEIGLALLERLQPYLDRFLEFMDQNGPFIEKMFDNIFQIVETLTGKLGELGEAVMPVVIDLFTNETFMGALERIGTAFLNIVDEVITFIDSGLGQFLLKITSGVIITGINLLAGALEFLNDVLSEFNRLLSGPVKQTDILKGLSFGEVTTEMRRGGFEGGGYLDFATGGVVMPQPGGVLGRLAEVGQPEVVIPLTQLDSMLSEDARSGGDRKAVYNINVNAGMGANGAQIGEQIVTAIKRYERTSGPVFASA
jgi:TP901 family phage tail tape measure protein